VNFRWPTHALKVTCSKGFLRHGSADLHLYCFNTVVSNHFHYGIPSTFCCFRPPDHVISMEWSELNFRCQCTQQKLQSICAVLTFDPQLNIFCKRQISIKLFYLYQSLQCRDNYFFKIKFVFFLYLRCQHQRKTSCLYVYISDITDSEVPNTSIYSAVSLASPYYNYLYSTASMTMICWRCHSNSVYTGSRLPRGSDVKTRKRRNVVGIDMIRNNRIAVVFACKLYPWS
jgi:hypothetical protein